MTDFITLHAGMIGLLFFFVFFCCVALWVFRPGSKKTYRKFSYIPFEEKIDD